MGADDDLLKTRSELDLELEEVTASSGSESVVTEDELEQYGVWVKIEPETIDETFPDLDSEAHLEDLDTGVGQIGDLPPMDEDEGPTSDLTEEEEELLGDLESETSIDGDLSDFDIPMEDDLDTPVDDQVEVPLSDDAETFDDLSALEEELTSGEDTSQSVSATADQPDVLRKIEEELSAIKGELTQLKEELATLRTPGAVAAPIDVAPPLPSADDEETGFFADDGDETIALTGDELDNILNTAEITEEEQAGNAVAADELGLESLDSSTEDDLSLGMMGGDEIDLDSLEAEAPEGEVVLDELSLGDEQDEITLEEPDVDEIVLDEVPEVQVDEINLDSDIGEQEISIDDDLADLSGADEGLDELSLDLDEAPVEELSLDLDDELSLDATDESSLAEISLESDDSSAEEPTLVEDSLEELSLNVDNETDALEELDLDTGSGDATGGIEELSLDVEEEVSLDLGDEVDELSLDVEGAGDVELDIPEAPLEELSLEVEPAESMAPEDGLEELSLEIEEPSVALSLEEGAADEAFESLDELNLDLDEPMEELSLDVEPEELGSGDQMTSAEPVESLEQLDELEVGTEMDAADELAELTELSEEDEPGQVVPVDEVVEDAEGISFDLADELESADGVGALEEELSLEIPAEEDLGGAVSVPEDDGLEALEEIAEEALTPEVEELSEIEPAEIEEEITLELSAEEEPAEAALPPDIPQQEIALDALDVEDLAPEAAAPTVAEAPAPVSLPPGEVVADQIPTGLQDEIRNVLKYMDQLLESLPDDKIEEFARSEYFEVYKRLFEELEIVS